MLREIVLKKVYSSDQDNLLKDFYVPVLSRAHSYKRISGYFSSRSILAASQGMSSFFMSGGKYQLIMGAQLTPEDYKKIKETGIELSDLLLSKLYFDEHHFITELEQDYLRVFGHLLSTGVLEIKIASINDLNKGIFHEKIGILEDNNNNSLSFSGSINETAAGWGANIEEFKVFRSWENEEVEYLEKDKERFHAYWNNHSHLKAIPLPEAIKEKIAKSSYKSEDITNVIKRIKTKEEESKSQPKELYEYQKKAVEAWTSNTYKGILEMATGTGKTLTALGCIQKLYEDKSKYFCVIGVPQKHLVTQWKEDVKTQLSKAHILEVHSSSNDWRDKLRELVKDYHDEIIDEVVVLGTHSSIAGKDFISLCGDLKMALIADEMHNMGAPQIQKALLNNYIERVGLSATPVRAYDEEGSELLEIYFSGTVYEYSLSQAINDELLTPYKYYPIFVELNDEETEEYIAVTKKIQRAAHFSEKDRTYFDRLLLARSRIVKSCANKMMEFHGLMTKIYEEGDVKHLLIYCDQGDQLELAQQVVNKISLVNHRFTQTESMKQRKRILELFNEGSYQCLLAVKCLDEGVNVPATRTAIILASTSNPREYIQRRGRVLRKFPGKKYAIIYDFVVTPQLSRLDADTADIERKIFANELRRIKDFVDTSSNTADSLNSLYRIMKKFNVYFE